MKMIVVMYRTMVAFAVRDIDSGGTTLAHHTSLGRSIKPKAGSSAQAVGNRDN